MKYKLETVSDVELMAMFEKSNTDIYWLEYDCGRSQGQPLEVYKQQLHIERDYFAQLSEEMTKRGFLI
jgi:hypothetical protein